MTDDEVKAEEYCNKVHCKNCKNAENCFQDAVDDKCDIYIITYQAHLNGLAEGRKAIWHDLRKDPNDLPTKKGGYWTKYNELNEEKGGYYDSYYYDPDNPWYKSRWYKLDIIAWCELPKFKE